MSITDPLQALFGPADDVEPADALLALSKTLSPTEEVVEKRPTPDAKPRVEEDLPDGPPGPVEAIMPEDQDLQLIAKLRGYGARRDGKRLVLELGPAGTVTYVPRGGEFVAKTERGRLTVDTDDPEDTLRRLGFGE